VNLSLRAVPAFLREAIRLGLSLAILCGGTFGIEASCLAAAADGGPGAASASGNGNNGATQPARSLAQVLREIDTLHVRRDEAGALPTEKKLLDELLVHAPQEFEVLWRAARYALWISDDPGLDTAKRSVVGKEGWELAERALAREPTRVEGHYWAAVNIGNYALGLGIWKALASGLEGKFRSRLSRAEALDARYEKGAIDVAWGRFFQKLPWPKRDTKQAAERFGNAIRTFPGNLRARVYLASLYEEDDKHAEAKRLLDEVLAATGGADPAEDRRAKALATGLLADVVKKMR